MNRPATVRTVKYFPLLLATTFLTACQTSYFGYRMLGDGPGERFTRLTVTDYEGNLMAEWIAEGYVWKAEQGYNITAIQRTTAGANPTVTRYPNGWRTAVTGPNIVKQRIPKPDWVAELDGEARAGS